jgi:transcriptional regulator with XRE-family HTH domain
LKKRRDAIPAIRSAVDIIGPGRLTVKVSSTIWHSNFFHYSSLIKNVEALDKAIRGKGDVFVSGGEDELRIGRARVNWGIMRHRKDLKSDASPACEKIDIKNDGPALIDINGDAYECISQKSSLLGNINEDSIDDLEAKSKKGGTRYRHGGGCGQCVDNTKTDPSPPIARHYESPKYASPGRLLSLFKFARNMSNKTQTEVAALMGVKPGDVSRFESYTAPIKHEKLIKACETLHINPAAVEDLSVSPFIYPHKLLTVTIRQSDIYAAISDLFNIAQQKNIIFVVDQNSPDVQIDNKATAEKHCHTIAVQDIYNNLIVFYSDHRKHDINPLDIKWIQSKMADACSVSRYPLPKEVITYDDSTLRERLSDANSVRQYFDKVIQKQTILKEKQL